MFLPLKLLLTSQFRIKAGCRFIYSTTTKLTRFQNGGFRNRLKNEVNAKMEAKQSYVQEGAELRPKSHLWRAAAFTALTGITTFSIASISEYQKTKKSFHDFVNDSLAEFKRIYFGQQELNKKRMDSVIATLIASNVAVFALWRFTQLRSFMNLFFMNGFASKLLCLPMLLSVFSHSNFLHLCANMYVLNSFADATLEFLGKEQFLAFYLTAGVFASFISLCEKSFTKTLIPSLGASGAIAALIGYVCIVASDAKISILFIPQFQFSAGNGLIGIILFEAAMLVVGMFTKFRIFDNAAHLGGLLFGVWYAQRGQHFYSQNFSPLLHNYCESSGFSNSIKKDNKNTPVIIYDGKNHVHTTLDELQNDEDDFQYNVENERLEADRLKKLQQLNNQLQIRKQWGKYQREKEDKQRQRKEKIFEERRRMRMEEETEEDEDNNNQNNEEET